MLIVRTLFITYSFVSEEDIGNSRDASFGDMVLSATGGMGCNIVLCCLTGEMKNVISHSATKHFYSFSIFNY